MSGLGLWANRWPTISTVPAFRLWSGIAHANQWMNCLLKVCILPRVLRRCASARPVRIRVPLTIPSDTYGDAPNTHDQRCIRVHPPDPRVSVLPKPFCFKGVYAARLEQDDWAFSGRSGASRRTITASVTQSGTKKMKANWIYKDSTELKR